jgi:hypothetical protein
MIFVPQKSGRNSTSQIDIEAHLNQAVVRSLALNPQTLRPGKQMFE